MRLISPIVSVLLGALALLPTPPAYGVTDLPDTLWGITELDPSGSPYRVTTDTVVPVGSYLVILDGVTIRLAPGASLVIRGRLDAIGTTAGPIRFEQDTVGQRWGAIGFDSAEGVNQLVGVEIRGASRDVVGGVTFAGAVGLWYTDLRVLDAAFEDTGNGGIHGRWSNLEVRDCAFTDNVAEDVIIMWDSVTLVENSTFIDIGMADAIEALFTGSCTIRGCLVDGGRDDGIDMNGELQCLVEDTVVRNCTDAGISLSEGNSATVRRTVVEGCTVGLKVKTGAEATGIGNTFVNLQTALGVTGEPDGSGGIDFVNVIFWAIGGDLVVTDGLSPHSIRYSLTDPTDPYPGEGNIAGDPNFVNIEDGDYHLRRGSICIDAGDPATPVDPDGTRADMGAFPFDQRQSVLLNEILVLNASTISDPSGEFDPWLELFAVSDVPLPLDSVYVSDDLAEPSRWRFPPGAVIDPGGFALVWTDGDTLQPGWHTPFTLDPEGGWLGLFRLEPGDSVPGLVDSVTYLVSDPDVSWGRFPDATGPWFSMTEPTPGAANSDAIVTTSGPEGSGWAGAARISRIYPLPVTDGAIVDLQVGRPGPARLGFFDLGGRHLVTIFDGHLAAGPHRIRWDGRSARGRRAPPGVYFLRIWTPSGRMARKVVVAR